MHPSTHISTYVKVLLENNIYKGSRNCWNVFQACSGDAHALARHPREGGPLRGFQGSQGDPGISPRSPKRPNQATEMGSNVDWTYLIIFNNTGDPDAGGERHITANISKRAIFAPQGDHVTLGWGLTCERAQPAL